MTTAIIQARMGSTRLPNKTLAAINGKPMLDHVIQRVLKAKSIARIIIATTSKKQDLPIVHYAKKNGIPCYCGSEHNVLDRFYQAASKYDVKTIVRITPDCPLITPDVIDQVVMVYKNNSYDYVTNTIEYTFPEGLDVEVFSFGALARCWQQCKDRLNREHVTAYLRNSGKFKCKNVESKFPVEPGRYKWSVDTQEDLNFVRSVYKALGKKGKIFTTNEVIKYVESHQMSGKKCNDSIINEGYYRSFLKLKSMKPLERTLKKSKEMFRKAELIIPGVSQTLSKGPSQFVQSAAPNFIEKGEGCYLWDVDGNKYIDYAMSLGPVILGHNDHEVTAAVTKAIQCGTSFTLPHKMELELSQLLVDSIPCAQMVRFGKNGSDVTSGAVRLARAITGKDLIACCGYHGWQDWYVGTTLRNKGVPKATQQLTKTFKYNQIETLEKLFSKYKNKIACVILEPIGIEQHQDNFLNKVRRLTHQHKALLIFDEVVTGFRFALGGIQEYLGVEPDLACFGKAMANGFPISALVGRKKYMSQFDQIFFSFTFGGEISSMSAAIATIKKLKNKSVFSHLWEQGRKIKDGLNVLAAEYGLERFIQCVGYPPRTVVLFKNENGEEDLYLKSIFQQECLKRGVLFTGGHNVTFSHSDTVIFQTLHVYRTVLEIIKVAIQKKKIKSILKGKPIQPVFRKA